MFQCLIRWLDRPAMPLCKKASKSNNSGSASRIDDSSPNLSTAEENRRPGIGGRQRTSKGRRKGREISWWKGSEDERFHAKLPWQYGSEIPPS